MFILNLTEFVYHDTSRKINKQCLNKVSIKTSFKDISYNGLIYINKRNQYKSRIKIKDCLL